MITTEEALELAEELDASFDGLEGSTAAGDMVRGLVSERDDLLTTIEVRTEVDNEEIRFRDEEIALAEKTIEDAPHDRYCGLVRAQQRTTYCNCWKADYSAAKEAL